MDVSLLWIFVFTIFVLAVILIRNELNRYSYWKDRGVPFKKPILLLGNLSFVMRKSTSEFFGELWKECNEKYVGIFLGRQPALVLQSPELARAVLVKDAAHFEDRYLYADKADPLGSLNLFVVKNPIWQEMRYQLSPMFTSSRLKMLTQLMNENSKELVKKIKRDHIDDNKPVHLKEVLTMYTSDTVGYTVFGLRVSALSGRDCPLWVISSHIVKWTFWRGLEFTMIFLLPFVAKLMGAKFFSGPANEYVKQLFWNVAKERKNTATSNDKDLVNHLLKLKDTMKLPAGSDEKLAENLMLAQAAVFILGSIETSSTTLSYCLHELAHHPDIQEKLFKEIDEAIKATGKDVLEYDELVTLKLLNACIYETMRRHPPVPYLDRICGKAYEIDGVKIQPGIPVFVNVMAIHMNPEIYPNPEKWDPTRPTAANDNDNMGFTFLPFGEGPRFCIGKRYGMMQVRAALAQMMHKYRVEPGPVPYAVKPDPYSVLLGPKNGGSVKFISR